MRFSTVILIVATIIWGTLLGGIVYSHIVYFPAYLSHLPESAVVVTGPYGLKEGYFWMTIHPLLILSLIIALIANWKNKRRRKLLLFSSILYAVVLAITSIYFLPELAQFEKSASSAISAEQWKGRTNRWFTFSIIRGIVMYAGIVPLVIGLTRPAVAESNYVAGS
ncbi:MAG: DUF1772 domain-containing protein [Chitinophagaceae bacterium]|nr:DUF1772 domain-containing protein [Chitinophagaceae bacterium]